MASSGGASSSLPRWQLALMVGAPVAIGLGYMYYRSSRPEVKPGRGKGKKEPRSNGNSHISFDDEEEDEHYFPPIQDYNVQETPYESAMRAKIRGNKLFSSGKFDEAIIKYNEAIEVCPKEKIEDLATFYQNRAAAYERLQKYSAVKADCTKALELKPRYVKALIRRARAMEASNDLETALEDITAACILDKFSTPSSLSTADRVLKQLGKHHAQDYMATKKAIMPSKHFVSTYFLAFHNDPIMSKVNELTTEDENTPFNKALAALDKQEYDDIIPLCTEALNNLAQDDNSIHKMRILLLRGTFYLLLGQHENALADLNAVIESESASKELKVNGLIKRASMYIQLESPDKSFIDFEEAVKLDPECGDVYHNRGQVHLLMEKVDEAKEDFEKAVQYNPGFGVAYVQKCYAVYREALSKKDMNMVNSAMTDFLEAFDKFPDCSECYTLFAQVLVDNQDFPKADVYFVKAAERDPENATILVYRGLLQLQWQNDIDKAVEYIRKAIQLDDKCEFAYETLGTIEVQRGNLKEAISLFDKALALGRTSMELTHIFSLRDAAKAQLVVSERLGADVMRSLQELILP